MKPFDISEDKQFHLLISGWLPCISMFCCRVPENIKINGSMGIKWALNR